MRFLVLPSSVVGVVSKRTSDFLVAVVETSRRGSNRASGSIRPATLPWASSSRFESVLPCSRRCCKA